MISIDECLLHSPTLLNLKETNFHVMYPKQHIALLPFPSAEI